jgi:hypothetical protein
VPFEFIDKVFAVMALCPQHTFQILTKRPERMAEYFADPKARIGAIWNAMGLPAVKGKPPALSSQAMKVPGYDTCWPWSRGLNGYFTNGGTSGRSRTSGSAPRSRTRPRPTSGSRTCCGRPAAVRFLSCEPLLGPVDLFNAATTGSVGERSGARSTRRHRLDRLGHRRRRERPRCPAVSRRSGRSLVKQCQAAYGAGVPGSFVKQIPHGASVTAGRLRSIPTAYPVNSPVRFVTEDGRTFDVIGWHAAGPQPDDEGKPTGRMELVILLREVTSTERTP